MRIPYSLFIAFIALSTLTLPHAEAWHDEGHMYTAIAALRAMPNEFPKFLVDAQRTVAHCSIDPDLARNKKTPQLADADSPNHFIDLELLQGKPLPKDRHAFIKLCAELGVEPDKVGYLPYALAESTQQLALALAEHRADPDNEHVKIKCQVYAGRLAHFAADLAMPLHTTINWDGKVEPGSTKSPRTGIHAKIDALPTKIPYAQIFKEPIVVAPLDDKTDLMGKISALIAYTNASHGKAYELEAQIPELENMQIKDQAVRQYAIERTRAAAEHVGLFYMIAWQLSGEIELPHWLDRKTFDKGFDETKVPEQPDRPKS